MPNEPFRSFGDTTVGVMEHEFRRLNSPLLPHARELFEILTPHTNLAMAQLAIEQIYWTYHEIIPKYFNNPWSISLSASGGVHTWKQYPDVLEAARDWRRRILASDGPYARANTVEEFINIYAPSFENDSRRYVQRVYDYKEAYREIAARLGEDTTGGGGTAPLNFDPARVPLPAFHKRIINKGSGQGASYYGTRYPYVGVLHRMQGTLWGTDTHFRSAAALTDFGLDHQTGEMIQWCDPFGELSGWASGPVSSPYGDGAAFLEWGRAKLGGPDIVNRYGVSLEISGYFKQPGSSVQADSPFSDVAKQRAAQWLAHFAQHNKIPWHQFPIRAEGFSFVLWHQEITIGTGKVCPGQIVMDATPELIASARDILKLGQTGTAGPVEPPKTDPPEIVYPVGLNKELATRLFGSLKLADGRVYAFDPAGPVSRAWLDEGAKDGEFGQLTEVITVSGKPYFRFSDGLILYAPNSQGAYRPLGIGEPAPAGLDQPK
jgi:hypothetical protein